MILLNTVLHFTLGTHTHSLHIVHVILAIVSVVPILWSAIWFGLRGAWITAAAVSIIYVVHMRLSWPDQPMENIYQAAIVAVYLFIGGVCGLLVKSLERERLRHLQSERNAARESIIRGLTLLAKALGSRDDATLRHSERVASLSVQLGRQCGLSLDRLETLRLAALVHDIGKIGISDDILHKPGLLDPHEFQQMRRHPEIAADILSAIHGTEPIADIVHAHHERLDGSGYPRGLQNEEISLETRILSAADIYCALSEERPYKPAMEPADVIVRMLPMAGKQLDAVIVDVLWRLVVPSAF
jgi:putative nucleotidyltransferase with HDIG domain